MNSGEMGERKDAWVESGRAIAARRDHGCFGCGALNSHGLRLTFRTLPEEFGRGVWAPFTPPRAFEGYTDVVNGGIVSTVLDEIMAWALYERGVWAVTAELNVKFLRPLTVGVETRAIGRLANDRGRLIEANGELRAVDGDALLASATGVFVCVPPEQAAAWADRYLPRVERDAESLPSVPENSPNDR